MSWLSKFKIFSNWILEATRSYLLKSLVSALIRARKSNIESVQGLSSGIEGTPEVIKFSIRVFAYSNNIKRLMLKAYCSCIYQYCSCTFPYSKIEQFGKLIWHKTLILQKEKRQMVELADSFQRHTFVTL